MSTFRSAKGRSYAAMPNVSPRPAELSGRTESLTSQVGFRTARAAIWMSSARLAARGIDFCLLIAFGRLLSAADFGVAALAMTLVTLLDVASELPVGQALVRISQPVRAHYDTAFTLAALRAGILGIVCMTLAWPFALLYHDPRLIPLCCILSLSPVLRGLASPRLTQFIREIDYRREFATDLFGKVASLLVGVGIALVFPSYWAIAACTLSYSFAGTVSSYIFAPYRPRFSLSQVRVFRGFLGWITATQLVNAIKWQSERLVLGRFVSTALVGQFSIASDLAHVPTRLVVAPITSVLLPAFSLLKDDKEKLRSSYLTLLTATTAIGIPSVVALCFVAKPATSFLFGPKWTHVASSLQVLCLALIPSMFVAALNPLAIALDQTHMLFRRNLYEFFVKLPLMSAGVIFGGFETFLYAIALSAVITDLMSLSFVGKLLDLTVREQLFASWRTFLNLGPMCLVLGAASNLSASAEHKPFVFLLISLSCAGLVYLGTVATTWALSGQPDGFEKVFVGWLHRFIETGRGRWRHSRICV